MVLGAYEVNWNGGDVRDYALSTPWNISTASSQSLVAFSDSSSALRGVTISADGRNLYVCGNSRIAQYTLSTPWNLSTKTFITHYNLYDHQNNAMTPSDVFVKATGGKIYFCQESSFTPARQYDVGDLATITLPSSVIGGSAEPPNLSRVTYEFTTFDGGSTVYLINASVV